MRVREADEAELVGRPQDELFGKARQVHGADCRRRVEIQQKIAVGHRVHAVGGDARKAQLARHEVAVYGIRQSRQCAAAERHDVRPLARLRKALGVPPQHLEIRQHVVGEQRGLGALEMGVARHGGVRIRRRALDQPAPQTANRRQRIADGVLDEHADVQRHLVVARARGVQPQRRLANHLEKPPLDVHVDVFELRTPRERAALYLALHGVQS